jgi:hypothetical protein
MPVLARRACFLTDVACGGRKELITELGHVLWPKLAAAYIEQRLSPAVPKDEAGLDAFQGLARAAERLEEEAAAMGYVVLLHTCPAHVLSPKC